RPRPRPRRGGAVRVDGASSARTLDRLFEAEHSTSRLGPNIHCPPSRESGPMPARLRSTHTRAHPLWTRSPQMGNPLDRRRFLQGSAAAAAGAAIATALPPQAAAAAPGGRGVGRGPADLIIRNGTVLLLDERFRTAEALAIRDGVVIGAGRDKDMRRFAGPRTEVLDAGGGTVLPGI